MMATDDLFACFGDDDDESDVDSNQGATNDSHGSEPVRRGENAKASSDAAASANRDRGLSLIEAYNANKDNPSSLTPPSKKPRAEVSSFRSSFDDQRSRTSSLPWPHRPPLYLGPIHLSKTLEEGGGRGYVATRDLPPGTCVLIEEPLVRGWSERQMGKRLGLESIRHLLEMDDAQGVVECMEELHPRRRKVDEILREGGSPAKPSERPNPSDALQILEMMSDPHDDASRARRSESEALAARATERGVTNSDGSALRARDVDRLLLALRYNGFDSGLYLHFSMFNHDEDPNCVKFRPTGGLRSEARTTRRVGKGEALNLHYLENPREVSHATRRKTLFDQHRFDIGDENDYKQFLDTTMDKTGHLFNDNERGNHIFQSELVGGKFPPSAREDDDDEAGAGERDPPATHHIEKSLDGLEDMLEELRAMLGERSDGAVDGGDFDRAAALELTVLELIAASRSALGNDRHVLLSRCRRLHLDAVELLLSRCSSALTEKQSVELMARFLPSVRDLLGSQRRRLGDDHPDVARTWNDLSMGIRALLSHSPGRLISLGLEGMETLDLCSRMEHSCRMEKERIEELYPRDVDEILRSVQKK